VKHKLPSLFIHWYCTAAVGVWIRSGFLRYFRST